ncbi:MAG: hypothetical protein LBC61_05325 [Candidatus Peribacteria bacterium]|nr:hypothetical protein [Candidatus Peribacteria bacterium]
MISLSRLFSKYVLMEFSISSLDTFVMYSKLTSLIFQEKKDFISVIISCKKFINSSLYS